MKLSIIIPVYNEEKTIEKILTALDKLKIPRFQKEILIVDDGSTDKTISKIQSFRKRYQKCPLKLIRHLQNQGKGRAIIQASESVTGDLVIVQDADLEYNPIDIKVLIKHWLKNRRKIIYGSRNLKSKRQGYKHYVLGVWFLTKLINLLYSSNLTDIYSCYKLIPVKVFKKLQLKSSGFEIEAEITSKVLSMGRSIAEVPIGYQPRKFSEGKKITWIDGVKGLKLILSSIPKP